MKDLHVPTTAFASSLCVCVLISNTEKNKYKQKLKAWGQRKPKLMQFILFNSSAVRPGCDEGAGRDAGMSLHRCHSTMVLNQTSCQTGCSEPRKAQVQSVSQNGCWLSSSLFPLKQQLKQTYETSWRHREKWLVKSDTHTLLRVFKPKWPLAEISRHRVETKA